MPQSKRPGGVRKGFAVVANEIRKLAEDSRNAAGEIQSVAIEVIKSVEELASGSRKSWTSLALRLSVITEPW